MCCCRILRKIIIIARFWKAKILIDILYSGITCGLITTHPSRKRIDLKELKTRQQKIDFALRDESVFSAEKLIIRQTADKLIATYDNQHYITRHSTHLISMVDKSLSIKYILALLNSKVLNFYYRILVPEVGKAFAEVKIVNLSKLPIKLPTDRQQKSIMKIVDHVLEITEKSSYSPKVENSDSKAIIDLTAQIDDMVMDIYVLTKERSRDYL